MAREPSPRGATTPRGRGPGDHVPVIVRRSLDAATSDLAAPAGRRRRSGDAAPARRREYFPSGYQAPPTGSDELNARPSLASRHQALHGRKDAARAPRHLRLLLLMLLVLFRSWGY